MPRLKSSKGWRSSGKTLCNMLIYRKRKPQKRQSTERSQCLFPWTQTRRMESKRTSLLFSHTFKGKQTPRLITVFVLKELSLAWKNEREATAHIASDLLSLLKRTLFSGYRDPDLRGKKKRFKTLSVTVSHMILLFSCVLTD